MYCFNCGHQIPDDSVFCPECGHRVDIAMAELDANASDVEAMPDKDPVPPTTPSNTAAPTTQQNSATPLDKKGEVPVTPPTPPAKRPNRKALIAILIVIVLLIAVVAAAGVLTGWFGLAGSGGVISIGQSIPIRDSVNDYSWEELSNISDEISATDSQEEAIEVAKKYHLCNEDGTLDGTQTKEVELSNGVTSSVEIIGFAHDDASDGSGKAGITFAFTEMVDFEPMSTRGSNEGGWKYSDLRAELNSDFLGMLPEDLQENIVEVDKSTNNVGAVYDSSNKTYDASCISTTPDKLWLLSYTEVVGDMGVNSSNPDGANYAAIHNDEGDQYQLFEDQDVPSGNGIAKVLKLENAKGTDSSKAQDPGIQWLRTPSPNDSRYAYTISNSSGYYNEGHTVAYSYGIAPCFCI